MKIPCEECLTRAICNQKEIIQCTIVDEWQWSINKTFTVLKDFFPKMKQYNWLSLDKQRWIPREVYHGDNNARTKLWMKRDEKI